MRNNLKIFNYMGNKQRHLSELNMYVNNSNKNIYVEPFLGSGALFLNLCKDFDNYFLSEKDPNLYNLWNCLIYNTKPKEFSEYYKEISFKFKVDTYDGYYNLRSHFNDKLYKTASKEEAYCLLTIIGSTLNSMVRFGPNGCNQSFGYRCISDSNLVLFEESVKHLIKIKDKIILKKNYKEIIDIENSLVFIDPPYYLRPMSNNNWKEEDTIELFNLLNMDNDIIYTDIENKYGDSNFRYKKPLNVKIRNISPNRKEECIIMNEMIYSNISTSTKNFFIKKR